jgi:hypothetical protein
MVQSMDKDVDHSRKEPTHHLLRNQGPQKEKIRELVTKILT